MSDDNDELAALSGSIAATDAAATPPPLPGTPGAVPEVSPQDAAEAWAEIPESIGLIVTQFLPELKGVYSRSQCVEWGRHMSRVADKYGWSSDGLPPEITAILCTAGFVLPTLAVIKTRKAAAKATPVHDGHENPPA